MSHYRHILLSSVVTSAMALTALALPAMAQDVQSSAPASAVNEESARTLPSIGTVVAIDGTAMILRGGAGATAEQLTVGAPISIHDVIATGKDSRAMIAFIDGSRTAIGAEAEMGIDNFNFNDLDSKQSFARFRFPIGPFHFQPGQVADAERPDVTLVTGYGKITVRGTDVWAGMVDDLYGVYVPKGELTIETNRGRIILREGEGTFIRNANSIPERGRPWTTEALTMAQTRTRMNGNADDLVAAWRPRIETQRADYRDFFIANPGIFVEMEQTGPYGKRNAMKRIQAEHRDHLVDHRATQQDRKDAAVARKGTAGAPAAELNVGAITESPTPPADTVVPDTTAPTEISAEDALNAPATNATATPETQPEAKAEAQTIADPVLGQTHEAAPAPATSEQKTEENAAPTPTAEPATPTEGPAPVADAPIVPEPTRPTDPHNPPPIVLKPDADAMEKIEDNAKAATSSVTPAPAPAPMPAPMPTPAPDSLPNDPALRQEAIEQMHILGPETPSTANNPL
ncbi:FecR domain-containing protein [Micavibrio aeruginosavorus]|nr:FecR domain-containing protein [Micavibrio aeruginosavorus]